MAGNNQLSGNTKNSSTGTSSTNTSSEAIGKHENEIVPHKISNHDKLVQTMVMVDGEWVNVNDTNDQKNVQEDMHKVNRVVTEAQKDIINAQNAADSAVKSADSAISASKVNSDAIAAQGEAISEVKIALDSAAAEIQLAASNAASDAAKIRADVARVQNEVDTAKAANSASVEALKSDIGTTKQDLANVHDSLTKAQSAVEQNQKLIDNSIAQINSDIEQDRKDIASAQQANADTAKQLDTYSKQAQDQGKTIKSIQDKQDGFTATLADVQGNVTQVSDKVDGLSAGLKDAQDNVASVKAQADQLNATLTDHAKSIATLTASAKELSSTLEDADGRLNKVEQTAQTNSSTLSDVQGDLSQVKQQADGLVSTLKDAQGNIDQLQQAAKGTAEQISDVQGDITNLQKDVNGIKLTIADHDKNIHTLQADSKSLQDDMADAKGNISSLQKTSTDLTSEVQDHSGRLSKVEQTASTLTNELSDEQGHLNRVEQTAQGTEQTVANQQGQINTIKTDATGIHETLTGQGNQIATINVTLDGLKSKYEGVSGDLNKLKNSNYWKTVNGAFDANQYTQTAHIFYQDRQAKNTPDPGWFYFLVEAPRNDRVTQTLIKDNSENSWSRFYNGTWSAWTKGATQLDIDSLSNKITTNSTAIDQTNKQISLKADQTEVNKIKGTVSQNSSRLDFMADQIKSKVTSTDVNNIINGKGYATTSTVQSLITQKAGTINESIANLTSKVNSNNGGGVNLLQGTAKCEFSLKSNGGTQTVQKYDDETNYIQHTSHTPINRMGPWWSLTPEVGQVYTLSADVCGNGYIQGEFHYEGGDVGSLGRVDLTNDWQRISNTFRVNTVEGWRTNWVIYANNSTLLKVKHIKIERGSVATPWTPAPSDNATVTQVQQITASIDGLQSTVASKADRSQITQLSNVIQSKVSTSDFNNLKRAVDMQTLDSADINNMKTNGHYFVHNLANNPVGGWVYVDVTGNGNSRIRQDVYQDNGNEHKYRRWAHDHWTNWDEGANYSELTQLRDDINLRVKSGDLLSQINIEAGRALIQSNKIYFDADSFVMSPNSKAFIPSAFITNLSADKITTGTLDASKLHVKNFSADNISGGTLSGVVVKSGIKDEYFQTTKSNIYWVHNKKTSLIGTDTYINPGDGLVIADEHTIMLTTWWGAMINDDGSITNNAGAMGYPKIVIDQDGLWDPGVPSGADWEHGPGSQEVAQWVSDKEYTTLTQGKGFYVRLDDQNKNSTFSIQKDNCVGAYFGQGDHGNQINFNLGGDSCGFNVNGPLHVTGSKNSIVETRQGYLAINAYETAEYYFGDIGENNTGDTSQVVIGIDRIFNEVVNTDIQYQVFVTPYSNAHVWVEKRYNNRFIVKSDRPNAEFGWELKAKRKGYESNRLRRVNVDFKHKI